MMITTAPMRTAVEVSTIAEVPLQASHFTAVEEEEISFDAYEPDDVEDDDRDIPVEVEDDEMDIPVDVEDDEKEAPDDDMEVDIPEHEEEEDAATGVVETSIGCCACGGWEKARLSAAFALMMHAPSARKITTFVELIAQMLIDDGSMVNVTLVPESDIAVGR